MTDPTRTAILGTLWDPPESAWSGLARDIVMWWGGGGRPTGKLLYFHLRAKGTPIPPWLRAEIPDVDRVPPKGTVVVCVWRAVLGEMMGPAPEPNRLMAGPGVETESAA